MNESKRRMVNRLRDDDGSTLAEIAMELKMSAETLLARYRRGDRGDRLRRPARLRDPERAAKVAQLSKLTGLHPQTIRKRMATGEPVVALNKRVRVIGGKTYHEWAAEVERVSGKICRSENVQSAVSRERCRYGATSDEQALARALDCLLRWRGVDIRGRSNEKRINGSPAEKGRG